MIKRQFLAYGLVAAIAVAAGLGLHFGLQKEPPAPPKDAAVAAMFLQPVQDSQGKPLYLKQFQGKALIVNFWATWCPPCTVEMPELSALQSEIRSKDIQIIGIGVDSATNVVEYARKNKIDYPLFAATANGADIARRFGNLQGGLPFTVVISRDGQVHKTYLGGIPFQKLRADLSSL